jgi:hypothetical protein
VKKAEEEVKMSEESCERSIKITTYMAFLSKINKLDINLKGVNFKTHIFTLLKTILQSNNISENLFDACIEGLSFLWLENPNLIIQD